MLSVEERIGQWETRVGFALYYVNFRIFSIQKIRCSDTFKDCWILSHRQNNTVYATFGHFKSHSSMKPIEYFWKDMWKTENIGCLQRGSQNTGEESCALNLINSERCEYVICSKRRLNKNEMLLKHNIKTIIKWKNSEFWVFEYINFLV